MRGLVPLPPTRLAIFATDLESGNPVQRLPLYAEIAVPRIVSERRPADGRLTEAINAALHDVGPNLDGPARQRLETTALKALGEALDDASQGALIDFGLTHELLATAFTKVLESAGVGQMAEIPPGRLLALLVAAIREIAPNFGLTPVDRAAETAAIWAEPLGALATDHAGYASFDLTRVRPEVQLLLAQAIAARRDDPEADLRLAIWIHPYGQKTRYDALPQARFAFDAIVARLEVPASALPPALINMGPRALQNPGLTDWRLSPASFAASPKTLIGENGCEELVPASLALQQFVLRQVMRLADAPREFNLPKGAGYKAAYVDDYKVSWYSLGHSLGEIRYSLPLAPGETVKLAVIDWSWDSLSERDEKTRLTEEVLHRTHRDRTITETVKAGLQEHQTGSSFMAGMATSAGATGGANLGAFGLGAAIGNAWSLGGSTATSEGSRNLAAENVQRVNDSFAQASAAQREINSTVVIQARQEEKESIQTRTFSNYNHSHTLTILYYEVLRHYRVTVEWVRRRPAVLVKMPKGVVSFSPDVVIANRHVLEPALIDASLKPGFDALEKQESLRKHQALHGIAPSDAWTPQWWEGDIEFAAFEFGIKTAEGLMDKTDETVMINLILVDGTTITRPLLRAWVKGGMTDDADVGDRFNYVWMSSFIAKPDFPVKWRSLKGFEIVLHDSDEWRLDRLFINGLHAGNTITLFEHTDVDFWFPNNGSSNTITNIRFPGPPPPMLPPANRSPERTLSPEERHRIDKLLAHLNDNSHYYHGVTMLAKHPNAIAMEFEQVSWPPTTMDDHVEPTPLDVFGSYVAYPLVKDQSAADDTVVVDIAAALNDADPARRQWAADQLAAMDDADRLSVLERLPLAAARSERLITLPTRGVFAEGKLGHCNVSEEIDNTRFWKWDEHPIPIEAPDIGTTTPISPSPQAVSVAPTAFPQSLVNIVNPSPAPDPAGLTAALSLLGTPGIFRDMSGREEVADLLKKLSDNSIGIADAANRAREIQAKYGTALDKQAKDYALGTTQAGAEVAKELIKQRREEAQQVTPSQAQDAIKLSEAETRKGNKTPAEHKEFSKQVQQNMPGAKPKRKSKENIKFNIDLKGYGNNLLVGRFGVDVKQRGTAVGFLMATDYSREGQLEVGVSNEFDDPRYQVEIHGEVLGGVGINALLRGRDVVQIPREDFDAYDYFYLIATAEVGEFEFETTKSDEIAREVAKRLGGGVDAEFAWKATITAKTEGGVEWKDGQTHTSTTAVKLKIAYYKGGFTVAYAKKP